MHVAAWRVASPELRIRRFDGDAVVYNPLSGHTHFIDLVGAELLAAIAEQPCDVPALCQRLAALLEVEVDEPLAEHVRGTLEMLEDQSLIEPVPA